jgi:hypothetical protein
MSSPWLLPLGLFRHEDLATTLSSRSTRNLISVNVSLTPLRLNNKASGVASDPMEGEKDHV